MWGLVSVLVWLTSFITFPTHANGFWAPKEAAWLVGSFALASSIFWNAPTQPGIINRPLGWFVIWIMLSFGWFVLWPQLMTPQTLEKQVRLQWFVSPILPTLSVLGSIFAMDALVRHTDRLERWHRVALHLVRIGTIMAVWAIAQRLWLDPLMLGPRSGTMNLAQNSPITALGNQTLTGWFLAVCAPLALMFHAWRYRLGAFVLMVLAIVVTQSASSLLAVWMATIAVFGLQRRWWLSGSIIGLGIIAVSLAWSYGVLAAFLNTQGRLEVWQTALALWLKHPLNAWIGFGAGSVGALTYNGAWTYGFLHNEPLQLCFEYGVIGGGLVGLAGFVGLSRLWRLQVDSSSAAWLGATLAYGIILCVGFPLRIGSLLMLGVLIGAALCAYSIRKEGSSYA